MTKYAEINLPAIFTEQFDKLRRFDKDLITTLNEWQLMVKSIMDRGISFYDNVDCRIITATSPAVQWTEWSEPHGLGKVPNGYIVVGQDNPGNLFDGTTTNTKTTIYFQHDEASVVVFRVLIF